MKPNLWVKSYPFPKEVAALTDLGREGIGMEIFLGGNQEKNEECLRICQDAYPHFGIELFCYQDEEKGKGDVIYNPLSADPAIQEVSCGYLFHALDLAQRYGATHVQLDGNDGYTTKPGESIQPEMIKFALEKKKGLLAELKQRYGDLPIYFENTFPIDDHAPELVFSLTGHRLSDFWEQGLPLEYDIAHHAIALDIYRRAGQFNFPVTEEEKRLAQRVIEGGITQTIIEDLNHISEIYFTHLGNATPFALQTKADVIPDEPERALVDLEQVLPVLLQKSLNITPEVADKDYVQRPNLRAWIKRLQGLTSQEASS